MIYDMAPGELARLLEEKWIGDQDLVMPVETWRTYQAALIGKSALQIVKAEHSGNHKPRKLSKTRARL